jgi:hypothetical protein
MLLFHRRTKKAIKYVWGFISILIVLSMVVTYSGFTQLSRSTPPVTPPTTAQEPATTPEALSPVTASNTIELAPTPTTQEVPVKTPPPAPLKFSL